MMIIGTIRSAQQLILMGDLCYLGRRLYRAELGASWRRIRRATPPDSVGDVARYFEQVQRRGRRRRGRGAFIPREGQADRRRAYEVE